MYLRVKLIIDKIFSFILLLILLPLFLIIGLILLITGNTPVFFVQERSGKNNITFRIYKFRTMDNDGNVNLFCNFLRRTGLDELPQVINILKGEMAFIGPRAWIVDYSKNFNKKQMKRLDVLPGITGLAQISKCKNVFEKIEKDCFYVDNISFLLDLKIIAKTFLLIFSNSKDEITEQGISDEIGDLRKRNKKKR